MERCVLHLVFFMLLVNLKLAWGFGFKGCTASYNDTTSIWCVNQNIYNVSDIIQTIPENSTSINFSMNKIKIIPSKAFIKFIHLNHLDLKNNRISSLIGREFRGLRHLSSLNLSCNKISLIQPGVFNGLTKLKVLSLAQNQILQIPQDLFQSLPKIELLDIYLNKLTTLHCGITTSSSLSSLNLFGNNINQLDVSCFPALKYINLSNNSQLHLRSNVFDHNHRLQTLLLERVNPRFLTAIPTETKQSLLRVSFSLSVKTSNMSVCSLLKEMTSLERVDMDLEGSKLSPNDSVLREYSTPKMVVLQNANLGNVGHFQLVHNGNKTTRLFLIGCGLMAISHTTFQSLEHLETLQLNNNQLTNIETDTFTNLTVLTFLSLDRSMIREIKPDWFLPLKSLTCLSLIKNEIAVFPNNAFSALHNLKELYIRFNVLKWITNQPFSNLSRLRKLDISHNMISYIEKGTFQDLINLQYLDMSGNRMKRVTPAILRGLVNLKQLILYNNCLHFEKGETPFSNMTLLENIELRYQGPGGRGIGHFGEGFFKDLRHLRGLSIGYTIMSEFHPETFAPLVNLKVLYLGSMTMTNTNLSAILSPLKSLKKLTLFRMDLDSLPANLLPTDNSLQALFLRSNHIHVLEKSIFDNLPMLQFFDIRDNPLSCTCENAWFKTWSLQNPDVQVSYIYDLHCDNIRTARHVWRFDDKACSYDQISLSLFLATSVLDVLCVMVCLIWNTQRYALRYLFLLLKVRLRGRRWTEEQDRFQYDAFISYSSKDEAWVIEELVARLEGTAAGSAPFRLCLHHRDFRPGTGILENIEAAIYSARRTICVVTRDFLRSEWCTLEFQLASLRLLCEGSDVLLLLFLEEIPDYFLSPYTRLQKMVRKKTYLLWPTDWRGQGVFWVRLKNALREGAGEEEGEEDRGDEFAMLLG